MDENNEPRRIEDLTEEDLARAALSLLQSASFKGHELPLAVAVNNWLASKAQPMQLPLKSA